MKRVRYTVLLSHVQNNVLVKKHFCTTTNFSRTYTGPNLEYWGSVQY